MLSLIGPKITLMAVLSLAPPPDKLFPAIRMPADQIVNRCKRIRIITEALSVGGGYTSAGQRLYLVSAGRGQGWDYRVYRKLRSEWDVCRIEASSRTIPKSRAHGWRDVFHFFAKETGQDLQLGLAHKGVTRKAPAKPHAWRLNV